MDRRDDPLEWRHKELAIQQVARELGDAMAPFPWFRRATLVPMPPSAAKGTPQYDDRLVRALRRVPLPLDVRELLVALESRAPAHESAARPSPDDHYANLAIDDVSSKPTPSEIGIFDDLLTSGAGFVGAKRRLAARFPDVPIVGIFIARVVHAPSESPSTPAPNGDR